uniref:F-box associated beta-propeller type 3 domain-containing protein n=1 Tax=Kalanchoe fedtschenkoi TaxID=63787 RepID=A0A7N0UJ21_KALFE
MSDALPDHIIYDILLLTPVKSLLRFRSLDRRWCETISSRQFAMDHLKRHEDRKPSHCVVSYSWSAPAITLHPPDSTGVPRKLDLPISDADGRDGEFIIRSSCHGILCTTFGREHATSVFLWNPVTRQCREVPVPLETPGWESGQRASNAKYALGFDPTTDDYKVVRMKSTRDTRRPNREIITLSVKSGGLKKVEDETPYMPIERAVAVDGYLYWLAKDVEDTYAVLKFDLAEEKLTLVPCPPEAMMKNSRHEKISLSLHGCGASVRLVRFEHEVEIRWRMKAVWLLGADGGAWSDVSGGYRAALDRSFPGWGEPLGFTSEAAVINERRRRRGGGSDQIQIGEEEEEEEDGVEWKRIPRLYGEALHQLLHCESLVSPCHLT